MRTSPSPGGNAENTAPHPDKQQLHLIGRQRGEPGAGDLQVGGERLGGRVVHRRPAGGRVGDQAQPAQPRRQRRVAGRDRRRGQVQRAAPSAGDQRPRSSQPAHSGNQSTIGWPAIGGTATTAATANTTAGSEHAVAADRQQQPHDARRRRARPPGGGSAARARHGRAGRAGSRRRSAVTVRVVTAPPPLSTPPTPPWR